MLEDDDDKNAPVYDDEEAESKVFRWMSAAVVMLAVAGFFGLAYYAYKSGSENVDEKDVETVHADATPVKEAPANPGGMDIPNQDKTVYNLINNEKSAKPVVEHVLPGAEEPVKRTDDTKTWMSDSAKQKTDAETPASEPALNADGTKMEPEKPVATPDATPMKPEQFNPSSHTEVAKPVKETVGQKEAEKAPTPAAASPISPVEAALAPGTPASVEKPVTAPVKENTLSAAPAGQPTADVSVAPATPKPGASTPKPALAATADNPHDSADDSDTKALAKPAPVKPGVVAEKAAGSPQGPHVQLGAFKTQAEAEATWAKISHSYSDDLSGKQHYVVRADLGAKGVFYRLQVAPFASATAAGQFCVNLVSNGQGCILARGK